MRGGWVIHFWLLNDTHFAWLDALTMSVNNPVYIFLVNPNIFWYYVVFIKYLCISKISIGLKSTTKKFYTSF